MNLLIVRHAIAEERGPAWPNDALRPLTERGRERMRLAAAGLVHLASPDTILTSPFARARQTASILSDRLPGVPVRECAALATGDLDALLDAVSRESGQLVALVGHEPTCSDLVAVLTGTGSEGLRVQFRKGAAALVACAGRPRPGGGTLEWLLQPRALRLLGEQPVQPPRG